MNEQGQENESLSDNLPVSSATSRVEQLCRRIETAPRVPVGFSVNHARRRTDFADPAMQAPGSQDGSGPGGLVEYWRMLRRRKWLLALVTIVGGAIGLLVTLPQTPVYTATTTIEVLDMNSGVVGLKDGNNSEGVMEETNLQTQVEILGSSTLQDRVIHKLVASSPEKSIEQPVDRMARWRKVLNDGAGARVAVAHGSGVAESGGVCFYFPRQTSFYSFSWPLTGWLRRHIADYDVVHIHALFSYPATAAAWLASRNRVPYMLRPLGTLAKWGLTSRRPLLKRWSLGCIEMRMLRNAAAVQATSEQERLEVLAVCPECRAVVIPNPVAVPAPAVRTFREKPSTILFLSRIDPKKGHLYS